MSFPSCLHSSKKSHLILPETSWWYLTFCGLIFSQAGFAIPSSLAFLSVPGILIYFEKALSTVSFLLHKLISNSAQPSSGSNNIPLLLTQPATSVLPLGYEHIRSQSLGGTRHTRKQKCKSRSVWLQKVGPASSKRKYGKKKSHCFLSLHFHGTQNILQEDVLARHFPPQLKELFQAPSPTYFSKAVICTFHCIGFKT